MLELDSRCRPVGTLSTTETEGLRYTRMLHVLYLNSRLKRKL